MVGGGGGGRITGEAAVVGVVAVVVGDCGSV